jgi:CrcB protein
MKDFVIVFIGGGLGSVLRFSTSLAIASFQMKAWIATLIVNVIGAALMLVLSYKFDLSHETSRLVKTGFLGALTTFSTFSLEVVGAFRSGNATEGISILVLNVVLGIVIGIWIFR